MTAYLRLIILLPSGEREISRKFQLDPDFIPSNNLLCLGREDKAGQVTTANSRHYIYWDDGPGGHSSHNSQLTAHNRFFFIFFSACQLWHLNKVCIHLTYLLFFSHILLSNYITIYYEHKPHSFLSSFCVSYNFHFLSS